MRLTHAMASAALIALTAAAFPATSMAGGLLDASATVGGNNLAAAGVNANVGGINANADATVGSSTSVNANVGTTTGKVVSGTVNSLTGTAATTARADVAGAIHAKAQLLGPKRLLKLCLTVGAKGCDSASRSEQLALIDARVGKLSGGQLARVCAAIGGGCGTSASGSGGASASAVVGAGIGGASPGQTAAGASASVNVGGGSTGSTGGSASSGGAGSAAIPGSSSSGGMKLATAADGSGKDRDTRITCRSVLASPARYETGLVKLCRKIGQ